MNHAELCAAIEQHHAAFARALKFAHGDQGVAWQACYQAARSWKPGTKMKLFGWMYSWAPLQATRILFGNPNSKRRNDPLRLESLEERDPESLGADLAVDRCRRPEVERDELEALRAALAAMPFRKRRIIEMRFFEFRTFASIAAEFGISTERARQMNDETLQELGAWIARRGAA